MKILFFSPVPTDPADAGNRVRIGTLTAALQQAGHEVHFAYLSMEPADLEAMATRFGAERLHVVKVKDDRSRPMRALSTFIRRVARALRLEWGFLSKLDAWYHPHYSEFLAHLQAQQQFQAVFVEYVFMSRAFDVFPDPVRRILDTHDRFGLRHRDFLAAGMRPRWFSTTMKEEEHGFRRAHAVLAIQEIEAGNFEKRLSNDATQVVQVGHLIELCKKLPRLATTHSAVFVGSDNPINTVGANHFVANVMPLIRAELPDFEFVVAGTASNAVDDAPGVVKLGFVDRLQDAFARGAIAVNPILMGTGVNIKLLDALACALPCVSTESGARGLDLYRGSAVTVVPDDDCAAFAGEVVRLLTDAEESARMGQAARQAAENWNHNQLQSLNALLDATSRSTDVSVPTPAPVERQRRTAAPTPMPATRAQ